MNTRQTDDGNTLNGVQPVQSRDLSDAVALVARNVRSCSNLELILRYLHNPRISCENEVLGFTDRLFLQLLKRSRFKDDPSIYLLYALFLEAFRPSQRVSALLTRVQELFPSIRDRFVLFRYAKDHEVQEAKKRASTSKSTNIQTNSASVARTQSTHIEEVTRMTNLSRVHMFRFWTLLSRKNFDVILAMKRAETGIFYFCKAKEMLQRLLREDPRNPVVLRLYSSILREIEGDLVTASVCLTFADNLEDMMLQEETELYLQRVRTGNFGQEDNDDSARINENEQVLIHPPSSPMEVAPMTIPATPGLLLPQTTSPQHSAKKRSNLAIPSALQSSIWQTTEKLPVKACSLIFVVCGLLLLASSLIFAFVYFLMLNATSIPESKMVRAAIAGNVEVNYMFEMMQATFQYSQLLEDPTYSEEDIEWFEEMIADNIEYSEESVLYLNSVLYRMMEVMKNRDDWRQKNFEWIVPEEDEHDLHTVNHLVRYNLNLYDLINWADDLLFESLSPDLDPTEDPDAFLHATVTAGLTIPFSLTEEFKIVMFGSSQNIDKADSQIRETGTFVFVAAEVYIVACMMLPTLISLIKTCQSHASAVSNVIQQSSGKANIMVRRFNGEGGGSNQTESGTEHSESHSTLSILSPTSQSKPNVLSEQSDRPTTSGGTFMHITEALSKQQRRPRKERDEERKKRRLQREKVRGQREEMQRTRMDREHQLRIEMVESRQSSLRRNTIPPSLIARFVIGIVILVGTVVAFFVPTLIIVPQMHAYSSRIIVNEYRRVLLTQISFLADMISGGFVIVPGDESVIIDNTHYGTPLFTNTSNLQSIVDLQQTLHRTASMYATLNQIFLLGSTDDLVTADEYLDGIVVAQSRNYSEDITSLLTDTADCYYLPEEDDFCEPGNIDGLEKWSGVEELLQRVAEAALILAHTPEDELEIGVAENTLITQLTWEDLDIGLELMGTFLLDDLDSFNSSVGVLLIVLLVTMMLLMIAATLLFLVTIPFSLRGINTLSKQMMDYAIMKELEAPVFSSLFETTLSVLDESHKMIIGDLTELFSLFQDEKMMGSATMASHVMIGSDGLPFGHNKQAALFEPMSNLFIDTIQMFSMEEGLMFASGFPPGAITQHVQSHLEQFNILLQIVEKVSQGRLSMDEGTLFTMSWMKDHMQSDDHLLGHHVSEALEPEEIRKTVKKSRKKNNGFIVFPKLLQRAAMEAQALDNPIFIALLQSQNVVLT
ncbi:hypothetical protein BLNAU_1477 [Blattamonas nauphoetae]|uniref:TmcB/TmcC TPR repeats domain-containing protein n=1 Tax=Blattamonas nauphoetae TaxID=2049346 RepID=A0ABQ9YI72_9EUKA|nr:hypothetical protein BLNAU_1477 [Blattamonas nauphoetae]